MPALIKKNLPKIILLSLVFLFVLPLPALASPPGAYVNERLDEGSFTSGDHTADSIENIANKVVEDLCGLDCLRALEGRVRSTQSLTPSEQTETTALKTAAGLIGLLINHPPASATQYLAYIGSKAGLISSTHAQGFAFEPLRPILKVWVVFRNLAYLAFVLIFVVIGLMIMFRVKIDPQTTISVEQALPKLITAILFVTFSFAIAGFLIEIMYLLMILAITFLLPQFDIGLTQSFVIEKMLAGDRIWFINQVLSPTGVAGDIAETLGWTFTLILGRPEGSYGVSLFATPIMYIVVLVIFLIALLKIFFLLLSAYIEILKLIIFSPLQIMFDALPIEVFKGGFTKWLRSLLANLLVFPAMVLLFLLAKIVVSAYQPNEPGWVPPLISGGQGILAIRALLGYGIILYMPKAGNMLKKALTEEKPRPGGMGTGAAALTQIIQSLEQRRMWMAMGAGRRFEPSGKEKIERPVKHD